MAPPITPDQLTAALTAAGVPFREVPNWRSRGVWRTQRDGWTPRGVAIHHTAGGLGSRSVAQYIADIINGDLEVPDKAHAVIDPSGMLWLNAAGRANHCVFYSDGAMAQIIAGTLPTTGSVDLRGSRMNMNAYSYGVECIAAGTPNAAQRATAVAWAAVLCRHHGWSGGEVFGHGEVAYDRDWSDPGWNMGRFRADVMAAVKNGPHKTPNNPNEGDDMPSVNDVWSTPVVPFKAAPKKDGSAPYLAPSAMLGEAASQATYATNLAREAKTEAAAAKAAAQSADKKLTEVLSLLKASR